MTVNPFQVEARAVKAALRAAFPGVSFSVTSGRGTSYMTVKWIDGPREDQVRDAAAVVPLRHSRGPVRVRSMGPAGAVATAEWFNARQPGLARADGARVLGGHLGRELLAELRYVPGLVSVRDAVVRVFWRIEVP